MILNKICIFDGSYLLHRQLKQTNLFELRNSELERTGGIYGFLNSFQKEIKHNKEYFPIVCWDDGVSDRRLALYNNYKKHEDKLNDPDRKPFNLMTEDELDEDYVYNYKLQRKKIIEILTHLGIPSLLFKHTEGDDLMYWLSKHSKESIVITDDKDLLQLLNSNCKVRQPMKDKTVELNSFLNENNYNSIEDFVHVKSLLGDQSDNIPSACFRVGEKTAPDCLKLYYYLKENNNVEALKDKIQLQNICKNIDIKFKSAYMNFNESQYLTNLQLIDLNNVHDDEINEIAIYDKIKNTYKNKDIKTPMELLKKYEIKTVNCNIIFEALVMSRYNIKEK